MPFHNDYTSRILARCYELGVLAPGQPRPGSAENKPIVGGFFGIARRKCWTDSGLPVAAIAKDVP